MAMPKDDEHKDLHEVLRWCICETNTFFHIIYGQGIWLDASVAKTSLQHGWCICESFTETILW